MLVLPLLGSIRIPDDPAQRSQLLGLEQRPTTKRQLCALLQDVFLLPYGCTAEAELPAGLSPAAFRRCIAPAWTAEQLEQLKKGLCRFVCAGCLPTADALPLLILASCDTRFGVATPALAELNKLNSSLDWSDPQLSAPIYTLYLGNGSKIAERKTAACSARVRQKLLGYLLRTHGRGVQPLRGLQVLFESLFGAPAATSHKCKVLALQFGELLVREGPRDTVAGIARVILGGVSKLCGRDANADGDVPADVQTAAYNVVAQLARTCPQLIGGDLQLVGGYFEHLCVAPPELQQGVREALVALAPAFGWTAAAAAIEDTKPNGATLAAGDFAPSAQQTLLLAMLAQHVESALPIVQNVASIYLTQCFPDHFVPARYLLLQLLGERERTTLAESVLAQLYGVSKKDHINYAYISTMSDEAVRSSSNARASDDTNLLAAEQRRIRLPDFAAMCRYVHEQAEKRDAGSAPKHQYGRAKLAYTYEAYTEMLEYLRLCLWYSAGGRAAPGTAADVHRVRHYVREPHVAGLIERDYLPLLKRVLVAKRGRAELAGLLDLLDVAPERFAPQCVELLEAGEAGLKDVSDGTRALVARVQGVLLAYGSEEGGAEGGFDRRVGEILRGVQQRSLEHRHGCVLTVAHAFQRRIEWRRMGGEELARWAVLRQTTVMLGECRCRWVGNGNN